MDSIRRIDVDEISGKRDSKTKFQKNPKELRTLLKFDFTLKTG
jgi:hypothetical protein